MYLRFNMVTFNLNTFDLFALSERHQKDNDGVEYSTLLFKFQDKEHSFHFRNESQAVDAYNYILECLYNEDQVCCLDSYLGKEAFSKIPVDDIK